MAIAYESGLLCFCRCRCCGCCWEKKDKPQTHTLQVHRCPASFRHITDQGDLLLWRPRDHEWASDQQGMASTLSTGDRAPNSSTHTFSSENTCACLVADVWLEYCVSQRHRWGIVHVTEESGFTAEFWWGFFSPHELMFCSS